MGLDIVLGGGGFIGGHLVEALLKRGRQVVSVDRNSAGSALAPHGAIMALDLFSCTEDKLADLFNDAEVVHHLVWSTLPGTAEADPGRDVQDNVGFTVRVLRAAHRTRTRVVFFSSGGTVYGEPCSELIAEDHPRRPVSAYGAAKYSAEVYAEFFARRYGLDVRIARLSNPYGATQQRGRLQGAVARFARQALEGERIEVWGDGSVVRDYLHVADAAECLVRLSLASRDRLDGHIAFNIGSGQGASLREVLALVEQAAGRRIDVVYSAGRPLDVSRNVLDIGRVRQLLDWGPALPLEEGLQRVFAELRRPVAAPGAVSGTSPSQTR